MMSSTCQVCGAKSVARTYPVGFIDYECGKVDVPREMAEYAEPCPNAERLLAEARATIARMAPLLKAAKGLRDYWREESNAHEFDYHMDRVANAVDAYGGTK